VGRDRRRARVILALLLLTAFTLLTLDRRTSGPIGAVRGAFGAVFGPVESGLRAVTRPIGDGISAAFHSGRDGARIRRLEADNLGLRRQVDEDANAKSAVAQLRDLGYLSSVGRYTIAGVRVVGEGPPVGDFSDTRMLDGGTDRGFRTQMYVVSPDDGLVGKIIRVDRTTSVVALITDPTVVVTVNLEQPIDALLSVRGQGAGRPLLLTLAAPTQQVTLKQGQRIVTAAESTVGSQGVGVGAVGAVSGQPGAVQQTAVVTPIAALDRLDYVGVLVAPQDAGGPTSSLPRLPSPTPTGTTPAPPPATRTAATSPSATQRAPRTTGPPAGAGPTPSPPFPGLVSRTP